MWIETQTLRCIIEGGGDVAFINTLHINQYLGKYTRLLENVKLITLITLYTFSRYFKITVKLTKEL